MTGRLRQASGGGGRVLTLFSGACGGWDLGMERAGYEVVAACEADPWRRAALQWNFPAARIYDDVRGLGAARLLADLGALPEVIVGSPPCQDASVANTKGRGVDGERTGLFFEFIRLVGECRPLWCCAENVPGLRTRGADRVLSELEALNYACWPLVVGAVHAGAPHRRSRVWLVAADAGQVDLWQQSMRESGRYSPRQAEPGDDSAAGPAPDADEARRAHGLVEPGLRTTEEPEHRRTFAQEWQGWNGGFAGFGRVDDGLPRGVARAALAAYGDAVVPQITEAIGRAMRGLTRPRPAEAGP